MINMIESMGKLTGNTMDIPFEMPDIQADLIKLMDSYRYFSIFYIGTSFN